MEKRGVPTPFGGKRESAFCCESKQGSNTELAGNVDPCCGFAARLRRFASPRHPRRVAPAIAAAIHGIPPQSGKTAPKLESLAHLMSGEAIALEQAHYL